jgi:PadR family transcriptional regulator AphA
LKKLDFLSTVEVPGEAHPMRKEFHITSAGKSHLLTWMTSPVERGRDMRQEFLARLYFACLAGKNMSRTLLTEQEKTCQGWLTSLKEELRHNREQSDYHRMVYEFRICQTEAMITWLSQCQNDLLKDNTVLS